jgi:endonuclease G
MLLGNPSGATPDPANRENYLMVKPYYALAYNNTKGTANWVSWRVQRSDLGDAPRKRVFDPDDTLPRGFVRITHRDYSGSGFDRGHLCPHGDRSANQEMSFATFVMTNIIPQAPDVNQKAWAYLEDYCRDLVKQRNHVYIVAGPAGKGGRGTAGRAEKIAGGKVTVPAECWKVVVVVPEAGGEDDLAKIGTGTRVIAVVMPNDNQAIRPDWSSYRTTPADVESRTGYRFFDRLPPVTAEALRQKTDRVRIPLPAGRGGVAD